MNKFKLMIADDNKEFCEIVKYYVQTQSDIEFVGVAHDGICALDMIEEKEPDIILVDNLTPNLDGIGVIKSLRKNPPAKCPKIVAFTTYPMGDFVSNAYKLGVDYLISGKMNVSEIIERCRMVINSEPKQLITEKSAENPVEYVTGKLCKIGVPASLKGYEILRNAIIMAYEDKTLLESVTKRLYPAVAKVSDSTPEKVERNIRNAIEVAWNRGNQSTFDEIFGATISNTKGRPTNMEFIAMLADKLRLELKYK